MQPCSRSVRDPRVDLLRGLSLLSIFVDHIPNNRLADYTLHNLGFSDAAELFVILAGFSTQMAYGSVFERDGLRVGLLKILGRCLKIYGFQVALLLSTLLVVALWSRLFGTSSLILGPLLRDGLRGTMRGLLLEALPTYLDILPLYIVLLAAFPLVRLGMNRSVWGTVAASFALYAAANLLHWNLPNAVDPAATTTWYFDPFTWQLVFVLGAAMAAWSRRGAAMLARPPRLLLFACWAYLAFALLSVDAWKLWPAPFDGFPGLDPPFALFGNEPKSFVTPWRLLHVLAIVYLALTSQGLAGIARSALMRPVVSCGRQSLQVFASGCILALFGRLVFKTAAVTTPTQIVVNVAGLGLMLAIGEGLEREKARRSSRRRAAAIDHARPAEAG